MNTCARTVDETITANPSLLKEAMQRYPSGVVIATTCSAAGSPRGFTASSFTSVSLNPALVLLCLARSAECHRDFNTAEWFAINMLRAEHETLALLFGSRGADKFCDTAFAAGPYGLPLLDDALAQLVCRKQAMHDHGDHTILIGQVELVNLGAHGTAMVRYERRFVSVSGEVSGAP